MAAKTKQTTKPPTLAAALLHVYERVGYAQKTGSMAHGDRYRYASEGDLISAVRPLMVEAGVVGPIPIAVERLDIEHAPTRKGARQFCTDVTVTYRFLHGPTGESIDVQTIGRGIDVGDKGPYKALTGAFKYALRQTFCIETGDDPDRTASNAQEAEAAQPPPQRQAPRKPLGTYGHTPPSDRYTCLECSAPMHDLSELRARQKADKAAGRRDKNAGPALRCSNNDSHIFWDLRDYVGPQNMLDLATPDPKAPTPVPDFDDDVPF